MAGTRQVVQVDVARADAELAADALWRAHPSAVSEEDLADGRVRLTADVTDPAALAVLPEGCEVAHLGVDSAHLDTWRQWAAPQRAGRHLVLQPAWVEAQPSAPDDIVVVLDPGRAFGSGSHATTRLVLAAVEDHLRPGDRVLDVGTGSGVLAVAAALLGAGSIVMTEIDDAALTVARMNAEANGVLDRVVPAGADLATLDGPFDLVLANIGAAVLRDLAPQLTRLVGPGGVLVLSGLLVDQADDVLARFGRLDEVGRAEEDGWTCVVLRSP